MFRPTPAPFDGSMPVAGWPVLVLVALIEQTMGWVALFVVTIIGADFWIGGGTRDWSRFLAVESGALLGVAVSGIWLRTRAKTVLEGLVCRFWSMIQSSPDGGRLAVASGRALGEGALEIVANLFSSTVSRMRVLQARGDRARHAAQTTNLQIQACRDEGRQLTGILRSESASLADTASGIIAGSARLEDDTRATRISAEEAERDVSGAIDRIGSLAAATRATTAGISRMAVLAVASSEAAFAAQRSIAAFDGKTASLGHSVDQVGRALQMAGASGRAASVHAARAGADGRAAANLAADLQQMAATADITALSMQSTMSELIAETHAAHRRIAELSDLIHQQHQMGLALGHAVNQQAEEITQVLIHLSGANAGFAALRAGVDAVTRSGSVRLADAEVLRGAANRLPAHADTIAGILRNIPDFAPPLEF